MRNEAQKGHSLFSKRSFSGYLKIVSSGASTVASTVKSAGASIAASIADGASVTDQVHWSGFDKLECRDGATRDVLLLAYKSGFEVWDVDEANDVHQLASRRDGPVSFIQILKSPLASSKSEDRFADFRPLLVIAGDGSRIVGVKNQEIGLGNFQEQRFETNIQFYSLRIHSYVHSLKLRSPVYSIRCGPRVVAVCQSSQIHCFDAATLQREFTFLTHPVLSVSPESGGIGYGPLAVGSRWLAYSGNPVVTDHSGRINPQPSDPIGAFSSPVNGSLVVHYAKESGKQLVSGISTLGDVGYKKLSKYCSERLPDGNYSRQGIRNHTRYGTAINRQDIENAGTVIIRDIVSRSVIVQFRAHSSSICALCFDPSGTLLVTASIHGHNMNIFHIMPSPKGCSSESNTSGSFTHLYKLQRGFTDAVIRDISFSIDSRYVAISSSKGTSHLFALPSYRGMPDTHPYGTGFASSGRYMAANTSGLSSLKVIMNTFHQPNTPIVLSAITRIRNGCNGWRDAVTDVATAAAGRVSSACGPISCTFLNCKKFDTYPGTEPVRIMYYILVFSPFGCLMQYVMQHSSGNDNPRNTLECGSNFPYQKAETKVVVEALQKWDICHKQNRRDNTRTVDMHSENDGLRNSGFVANGRKEGVAVYPAEGNKKNTTRITAGEGHNMYISLVELHMHPTRMPLWAKPEINFQVMMDDSMIGSEKDNAEVEIERVSACTIIARSKDLIPTSESPQVPRCQHSRSGILDKSARQPLPHGSSLTEVGKLPPRSCLAVECFPDVPCTGLGTSGRENGWDIHPSASQTSAETVSSRNSMNIASCEHVDKVMVPKMKTRLAHVHNTESPKMENLFLDGDNDID